MTPPNIMAFDAAPDETAFSGERQLGTAAVNAWIRAALPQAASAERQYVLCSRVIASVTRSDLTTDTDGPATARDGGACPRLDKHHPPRDTTTGPYGR